MSSVEAALALCEANNACTVHSSMRCLDVDNSHEGAWTLSLVDDLIVSHTRRLGLVYERTASHIAGDADDSVMVHFNIGGSLFEGRQMGHEYLLPANAGALYVHNAPVRAICGQGSDFFGIRLPRELARRWRTAPEDLVGQTFDIQSSACQLLKVYMEFLGNGPAPEAEVTAAMKTHIGELAGLWLGGLKSGDWRDEFPTERQKARYFAIRRHLDRHFADPNLAAQAVGRALGISERMVQHILTQEGLSFSRLLGRVRAEKACEMLESPAHRDMKVIEVALSCGFYDLSAFYRAFRLRYDETPGSFRAH